MREIRPSGLKRGEAAATLPLSYSTEDQIGMKIRCPLGYIRVC